MTHNRSSYVAGQPASSTHSGAVVDTATGPDSDNRVFLLILTYTAPLTAVDAAMPAHRRFLDEHFATGEFLASGPRDPRTGGVILARVRDRDRVAELVEADPFTRRGLATYQVHAFAPTRGPFALPLRNAGATLPSR